MDTTESIKPVFVIIYTQPLVGNWIASFRIYPLDIRIILIFGFYRFCVFKRKTLDSTPNEFYIWLFHVLRRNRLQCLFLFVAPAKYISRYVVVFLRSFAFRLYHRVLISCYEVLGSREIIWLPIEFSFHVFIFRIMAFNQMKILCYCCYMAVSSSLCSVCFLLPPCFEVLALSGQAWNYGSRFWIRLNF